MSNKIKKFFTTTGFPQDNLDDLKWYDWLFDFFFPFGPIKISSKIPFWAKFIFNVVVGSMIGVGVIWLILYIYWKFFIN